MVDSEQQLRRWLETWSGYVAAVDFDAAARLFDPTVVGYGTKANEVRGLPQLIEHQWSHVWPNIEGFAFDHAEADVWVSPDGLQGVIGSSWRSLGRRADGSTFPRVGRATIVLSRSDVDGPWLGLHTHLSLEPIDPGTYIRNASAD